MKADACYEHKPNLYHFKKNYLKFMHLFSSCTSKKLLFHNYIRIQNHPYVTNNVLATEYIYITIVSYFGCDLKMTPKLFIMLLQKLWQSCNSWSNSHNTVVKLLTEMIPKSTQQLNKAEKCVCFCTGLQDLNKGNDKQNET
jgi:hypothetical protein